MGRFENTCPSIESYWRAVILFGRNVASYKFALGKSLIELSSGGKQFFTIEELADPFSKHLIEHLKASPKQTTSTSSRFLDACRKVGEGEISKERLIDETVRLGFNNVIDAFHVVNTGEIPVRFYVDRRNDKPSGIELTDDFFRLKESVQFASLPAEVESRWRLVETAWELQLPAHMLLKYDPTTEMLATARDRGQRTNVTSCRDALNGYQKGKCFYCFADVALETRSVCLADVDHFVPHLLKSHLHGANLDGVWNLVLACRDCNRGIAGKSARVPAKFLLERLHTRNEFYIASHHPLRETLISQTGATVERRVSFLNTVYREAHSRLITAWTPTSRGIAVF